MLYTSAMNICRLPEPKATFADKPFSALLLTRTVEQIFGLARPFTGFLKITTLNGDSRYLFFLQSEAYAAGKLAGNKPFSTTISGFFAEVHGCPAEQQTVSLFEIDPVLLKSMLVFIQEEPTLQAPATLIPVAEILWEIFAEKEDALIVLEKERVCNFFFIKQGIAAPPHLADSDWTPPADLSGQELILQYVTEAGARLMTRIYRTTATGRAADAAQIDRQKLLELSGAPSPA